MCRSKGQTLPFEQRRQCRQYQPDKGEEEGDGVSNVRVSSEISSLKTSLAGKI